MRLGWPLGAGFLKGKIVGGDLERWAGRGLLQIQMKYGPVRHLRTLALVMRDGELLQGFGH